MIPSNFQFPNLDETITTAPVQPKRALLERIGTSDDFLLKIDNTTASIFQTCPRAASFYTVFRRQRPDRAPLVFGGAIHMGLETIYKHGFEQEKAGINSILNYFSQHPYSTQGEWRTPSYAVEAFQKYCSYWSLMDNIKPLDSSWVERAFSLNVGSVEVNRTIPYTYAELTDEAGEDTMRINTIHVQWCGKMDIVGTNGDSKIYVMDHKTSSMGGQTFYADFILGQQTHGYQWAAQEILGQRIAGFILNALLIRKPSRTGTGIEFDRRVYDYTQESILEWKQDMMQTVESFIHALTHDEFPKFTTWCMGKYGACQYHDVCTLPKEQRAFMLYSDMYANVTWSPLNETVLD